ncbi:hypothetical protein [Actinomadura keratinilytica]|uniref:hypothetical protein n=1 Tax=Actinomadura keratinilytica TaxID=547461 RepID=UPI00361C58ED
MRLAAPRPFDVTLAATGVTVVSHWAVPDPDRQREVADALFAAWEAGPLPDGLLSADTFTSTTEKPQGEEKLNTEDSAVVVVSQWRTAEDYERFAATAPQPPDFPGVQRPEPVVHRLYRGTFRRDLPTSVPTQEPAGGADAEPGCIFIAEFEMADTESAQLWSDAVYDALEEAVVQKGCCPAGSPATTSSAWKGGGCSSTPSGRRPPRTRSSWRATCGRMCCAGPGACRRSKARWASGTCTTRGCGRADGRRTRKDHT